MSDNPTLSLHGDDKLMWVVDGVPVATATLAEVLAALPDKEWWCFDYEALGRDICSPEDTHSDTGRCHWAVKP